MGELLHVSSSPHIRSKVTTDYLMKMVIVALMPATVAGVCFFGWKALLLVCLSVATCVATEGIYETLMHKPLTIWDGSAVITGLLLGLNLPASAPWWIPVIGGVFAILIVKQLFGGLGQNIMNPALAARCFLLLSFTGQMTNFSADGGLVKLVDTVSGATYSSKGIISAVKNALTGEKDSGTTGSSQEGTSASQSQSTPEAAGSVQEPSAYKDGTYYGTGTGFAGNLKVEVVINGGKISNIQIVETNDGSEYIQKASGVINRILGAQSTNGIDTVSGATFSSNGIIKAVRNALSQAAATESVAAENRGSTGSDGTNTENKENTENNTTAVNGTLPYNEGVYYGTAEGYNGDITVAVVIQEKTLKAVLVIGEEDDDAFFGRAMDVVTQMMKKQSTEVDTVSGATYSSKGLIQAVKNALEEAKRVTNGETDTDDDNNVVQLNTEEVEKAIDAVNELNGSDYTSASWAVVKVRLKDARKVLKNATEQTQLDEAAVQLNQAVTELQISDGTNDDPEPDLPPESTYIDGVYPVTVLCLPDADMDFEAYNLFAQVTIQDDKIIKIDNVYGDGGSGNDSYINKAVNGTSSKTGVVKQITEKGNLDGIDTVSRATCTSQAIIDACQQALNNAKRQ
mgnify:CR=1 FL=1